MAQWKIAVTPERNYVDTAVLLQPIEIYWRL